ncbi:MAG: OmpA family protein [Bacteroidetes bacterium]|nr:OmpA family protein [Bacteroidota bacterium]
MKKILIIIFIILLPVIVLSNTGMAPDTIVTVSGQVISEDSKEPLKAIVEYKKLPYGSEIGTISSNNNGEFTIYLHDNSNYSIKVGSKGFFSHIEELDVNQAMGDDGNITMHISLASGDVDYVFRLHNLIFEVGSYEITSASFGELDNLLVARLNEYPNMVIQLEGHTDPEGNTDANMKLSQDRVNAVKNYLVVKGIDAVRIKTKAFGGTQPVSKEATPEARRLNRRVEVRILKVE